MTIFDLEWASIVYTNLVECGGGSHSLCRQLPEQLIIWFEAVAFAKVTQRISLSC